MIRTQRRVRSATAVLALSAITALGLTGCAAPQQPAASDAPVASGDKALVAAAKAEGQVVLGAAGHTRDQVQLLADEFEKKYGITVTFVRESGGDITQKVQAQLSAGALQFDVISLNDEATLAKWAEDDVLADSKVANTADTLGMLGVKKASKYLPFTWAALGYSYNSAKTEKGDLPKTWSDLADHDGVLAVANPGTSGAALTFFAAMSGIDKGFLPSLKGQDALSSDSVLALTQLVATGEADFGLPGMEADVATARNGGEPLAMGYPKGEIPVLASYIAALADSPHPSAARLLVQFQLSKEFQDAQAKSGGRSVLTAARVPSGAAKIAEDRLVVVNRESLASGKSGIIAQFDKSVAR